MARLLTNTVFKGIIRSNNSNMSMVASASSFQQGMRCSTKISSDADTHEDFQPTNKLESSNNLVQDIVQQEVKENPVVIYMKGVPEAPRCGFSALAVKVLQQYNVPIHGKDILGDPVLKNGVKAFTNWPTFPQVFVKGEFVGGSDIVLNMHQKGELKDLLAGISQDDN